jgi:hypothetical protein
MRLRVILWRRLESAEWFNQQVVLLREGREKLRIKENEMWWQNLSKYEWHLKVSQKVEVSLFPSKVNLYYLKKFTDTSQKVRRCSSKTGSVSLTKWSVALSSYALSSQFVSVTLKFKTFLFLVHCADDSRGLRTTCTGLGQRVHRRERFPLQVCNNFGIEMINRTSGLKSASSAPTFLGPLLPSRGKSLLHLIFFLSLAYPLPSDAGVFAPPLLSAVKIFQRFLLFTFLNQDQEMRQ